MGLEIDTSGTLSATGDVDTVFERGSVDTPLHYAFEIYPTEFNPGDQFKFTVYTWDEVDDVFREVFTKRVNYSDIKPEQLVSNKNDYTENLLHQYKLDGDFVDAINGDDGSISYDSNFVSWWKAEDDLVDTIGTQNLTDNGSIAYVDTPFGRGWTFDGSTDYLSANDTDYDFDDSDAFSVEFWVNFDSTGSNEVVIGKGTAIGSGTGYYIYKDSSDNIVFQIQTSTPQTNSTTSATSLSSGTWYHIVCTYDGGSNRSGMTIYVNGSSDATGSAQATTGSSLNNEDFTIGAESDAGVKFGGDISSVRVYSAELTANQVTELYRKNFKTNFHNGVGRKSFHCIKHEYATLTNESNFDYEGDRPLSWTFWIRCPDGPAAGLMMKQNSSSDQGWGVWIQSNGTIQFSLVNTNTTNELHADSTNDVDDDQWHFVAVTYDGSQDTGGVNIYIDGVAETVNSLVNNLSATILNNVSTVIGAESDGGFPFVGQLQDMRIYDEELTSGKVTQIYNATKGFYPAQTHLKFEDDATDSGLLSEDGTWSGTETYSAGKLDKAGFFDGSSQIDFAEPSNQFHRFEHNQPFTISCYAFAYETGAGDDAIICKATGATDTTAGWALSWNHVNNRFDFKIKDGTTAFSISKTGLSADTWYHITCTYDGSGNRSGMKIYIDGVLETTGTASAFGTSVSNVIQMIIGDDNGGSNNFIGRIDDFKVFWYEMTADEVAQLAGKRPKSIDFPMFQTSKMKVELQQTKGDLHDYNFIVYKV